MRGTRGHATAIGVAIAAALGLEASSGGRNLAAQSLAEPAPASRICFRGRPLPDCRSFWLFEMQAHTPLAQTSRQVSYGNEQPFDLRSFEDQLEWNLGHMVNVAPRLAIGGVLTIGVGGGSLAFTGLKARGRRWLNRDVSMELEAGLLRTVAQYPEASGVTVDARLDFRDQGSFYLRWDGLSLPPLRVDPGPGPGLGYVDSGGFQHALSVGVGLGSVPALVGTGALGLAVLFILSTVDFD